MTDAAALTVSDKATPEETNALCRAVLTTIWPDLDWFTIDLTNLGGTPERDDAVAALAPYRGRTMFRRRPTQEALIDLDDNSGTNATPLEAVLTLVTVTLASQGWGTDLKQLCYDVNDEGTSCYFLLTEAQRDVVNHRLRPLAVSPDLLVPEQ